jgi:hypothetical protein
MLRTRRGYESVCSSQEPVLKRVEGSFSNGHTYASKRESSAAIPSSKGLNQTRLSSMWQENGN